MYFIFQSGAILVLLHVFSFFPVTQNTVLKVLFELLCQTPAENLQIFNLPPLRRSSVRPAFQVPLTFRVPRVVIFADDKQLLKVSRVTPAAVKLGTVEMQP